MRFSVASGTDNLALQQIRDYTKPYSVAGLALILKRYGLNQLGPHGETQRWTYTVPADKIGRIDYLWLRSYRNNSPTSSGDFGWRCLITPANGSGVATFSIVARRTSVFGEGSQAESSPKIILLEGDEIEVKSFDGGIGGDGIYFAHMTVSEIDAI